MKKRKSVSVRQRLAGKMTAAVLGAVLCVSSVLTAQPMSVFASKSSETQEKINKAKEEKKNTENAIEQNQDQIDSLTDTKSSLEGELSSLNSELSQISSNLSKIEGQIDDKNAEIDQTQQELEEAQATADEQYDSMKKRLRFMYEQSKTLYLDIFFESKSYADMLNRTGYIEQLAAYDRKKLEEYQAAKEAVEEKRRSWSRKRASWMSCALRRRQSRTGYPVWFPRPPAASPPTADRSPAQRLRRISCRVSWMRKTVRSPLWRSSWQRNVVWKRSPMHLYGEISPR